MKIPFTNIEIGRRVVNPVNTIPNADMPNLLDFSKLIPNEVQLQRESSFIKEWRNALISAESVKFPNRTYLLKVYQETILDAHVTACIDTRKRAVLGANYIVKNKDGKDNIEMTDLLKSQWFYQYLSLTMDSIFWGNSMIRFGDLVDQSFECCDLVPRQYTKPELDLIVQNPGIFDGFDITQPPFDEWILSVNGGEGKRNLGLLLKISPLVIWKKAAFAAWANYNTLFGVPIRVGKLKKKDAQTVNEMTTFLRNMASSAYAVMGLEDEIELLETGKTSGQDVFDKMIERCNSEISKLILGQTGTTDEKSYSGAAKVHADVLSGVYEADQMFIENVLQFQLKPFLIKYHDFPLGDCSIEVKEDDELTLLEKQQFDIELLKTGKYYMQPKYLNDKYGTEVEDIKVPTEPKNNIDSYYE